jgi:catechol 2,3-dioxygenase-like lactoylglutathione lyase family enzyme
MKGPLTYGLTHLAIRVKDLERTTRFYTAVFDMEIMYNEPTFVQLTTKDASDILVFELHDAVESMHTGGIIHFGFRLRDPDSIDEMHQRILSAGGELIEQGEFVPGSPYLFCKDPDGYVVEVWYEAETC